MIALRQLADNPTLLSIALCVSGALTVLVIVVLRRTVRRVGGRPVVVGASVVLALLLHIGFFLLLPQPPQVLTGGNDDPTTRNGTAVEFHFSDREADAETLTAPPDVPLLDVAQDAATIEPSEKTDSTTELPIQQEPAVAEPLRLDVQPEIKIIDIDELVDASLSDLWLADQPPSADESRSADPPAPSDAPPAAPGDAESEALAARPDDGNFSQLRELRLVRLPRPYQNRQPKDRLAIARAHGGDARTEAAVEAGLSWLADAQRPDGLWDAVSTGAGRASSGQGVSRDTAGRHAETGLTGLALLALLGAGYTSSSGPYHDVLQRGLDGLVRSQQADGSLAGPAGYYAGMYCHGIAALALAEAAAIDGDRRVQDAARAALAYTVRTQHSVTGGWRYRPGDPGDLSQLGWQAIALHSGQSAGIVVPQQTQQGVLRFLRSVQTGQFGGLASYRPGEAASPAMTAEALATRLLLGHHVDEMAVQEAERSMLEHLPGTGQANYYYWYYASLALHQLQRPSWQTWNAAMKQNLTAAQRESGDWPTNTVWGSYGGRVYTTSVACLCLEVYYRHLTIHAHNQAIAARPEANGASLR